MPFTPFHLGPGALIKSLLGRYCSFMLFGFTQVVIDLESLYYIVTGGFPIHRFFHSWLGATVLLPVVLIGKPMSEFALWLGYRYFQPAVLDNANKPWRISWIAAMIGTAIGLYSHILLDSVMHSDMRPFAPLTDKNNLLYFVSVEHLHWFCVITGVVGGAIYLFRKKRKQLL
jgi:hypothetical protein